MEDRHRPDVPAIPDRIPERLIELRSALGRLTDRQRIVVVLRYFADMPDDEIAEMLDVRPPTVRSLAHRALGCAAKGVAMTALEDRLRRDLPTLADLLMEETDQPATRGPGGDG